MQGRGIKTTTALARPDFKEETGCSFFKITKPFVKLKINPLAHCSMSMKASPWIGGLPQTHTRRLASKNLSMHLGATWT